MGNRGPLALVQYPVRVIDGGRAACHAFRLTGRRMARVADCRWRAGAGAALLVAGIALASCGGGPPTPAPPAERPVPVDAPALAGDPLRQAYFGDLHVHSSWSLDAYQLGGDRDPPAMAYRFGRGESVTKYDGSVHRLRTPLDFMAVTDHDHTLGEVHLCNDPGDAAYDTPICRSIRANGNTFTGQRQQYTARGRRPPEICGESGLNAENRCYERSRHLWEEIQENADAFYEPGRFTTFPAYEWTATPRVPGGAVHLHRNVIFNGRDVPAWGGSAVEMENRPERLWEWLAGSCTGECRAVAIPHNTNLAGGLAFTEAGWRPHTPDILRLRARAEPLIEIHQIKGNSECFRGLGTTDEECNFETYRPACEPGQGGTNCINASDMVRNALKEGLRLEAGYGVNPYKLGFIASPDDHQALPGAADEDYFTDKPVKFGVGGALGEMLRGNWWDDRPGGGNISNPGGLAGVWAEANTRESIFAALQRKETFGTSGPRIRVRFFAGWDYPADLHARQDLVETAYRTGVTMGADLPAPPSAEAVPRFVVWATKGAASANLQKIQVVKGWVDAEGEIRERVFDAVCADGLEPDAETRRCPDNGATVDLSDCSYSAGLGAAELSATWTDPEFDPALRAFYYVRVLENPTCRWTSHRALARGIPVPDPAVIKERAWSSPIWYAPAGE